MRELRIDAEDGSSSWEWNASGTADFGNEVVSVLRLLCCSRAIGVSDLIERVEMHLGASIDLTRKLRRTNRDEEAMVIVVVAPQIYTIWPSCLSQIDTTRLMQKL